MTYKCNTIKLEKGMYEEHGRSFSQVLESIDPSDAYYGTPLEGLDAFQRQLKRFDIKVKGARSDTVEKFFSTLDSAVLFPEYVARATRHGIEDNDVLQTIIASTTKVDSAEQINDKQITFHKRGRALTGGYDITRRQRLDLFSVVMRQIGSHIVYSHLVDAVRLLIYGDCGCEAAEVTEVTPENWFNSTSGVVLKFQTKLDPYEMNTMLVSDDIALGLFQNLQPQLSFQHQGCVVTQFGTTMIRSHALPERAAIGLDNRFALEMVQIRDIETDYSALIDRHFVSV